MTNSRHPYPALILLLFGCSTLLLTACGSIKPYTATAAHNLTITTDIESGTWLNNTSAQLLIYHVGSGCPLEDLGVVELKTSRLDTGLAVGKKTYLQFLFIKNRTNGYSTTAYATVITPKPGARYKADIKYASGRYYAKVSEIDAHGAVREFERQHINCPDD